MSFGGGSSSGDEWWGNGCFPKPVNVSQPNVNYVQMDWRDILKSTPTTVLSQTSSFQLPQNGSYYTGYGTNSKQDEGEERPSFRISVGSPEEMFGGSGEQSPTYPREYFESPYAQQASFPTFSPAPSSGQNQEVSNEKVEEVRKKVKYEPCGSCSACKFQENGPKDLRALQSQPHICRSSPRK